MADASSFKLRMNETTRLGRLAERHSVFALVIWANLFGEYGRYPDPVASGFALIVTLIFALVAGTIVPWWRWRAADREMRANARIRDK